MICSHLFKQKINLKERKICLFFNLINHSSRLKIKLRERSNYLSTYSISFRQKTKSVITYICHIIFSRRIICLYLIVIYQANFLILNLSPIVFILFQLLIYQSLNSFFKLFYLRLTVSQHQIIQIYHKPILRSQKY